MRKHKISPKKFAAFLTVLALVFALIPAALAGASDEPGGLPECGHEDCAGLEVCAETVNAEDAENVSGEPEGTPSATPDGTSSATPDDTSSATPDDTSTVNSDDTSNANSDDTSSATPDGASSATSDGTPSANPDDESSANPDDESSANPEGTSSATPEGTSSATPDDTSNANPDGASSAAIQSSSVSAAAAFGAATVFSGGGWGVFAEETYTVTYAPGDPNIGTFKEQVYSGLALGDVTPHYFGTPSCIEGYYFGGWDKTPDDTVTGNVTYTALWNPEVGPPTPKDTGSGNPTSSFLRHIVNQNTAYQLWIIVNAQKSAAGNMEFDISIQRGFNEPIKATVPAVQIKDGETESWTDISLGGYRFALKLERGKMRDDVQDIKHVPFTGYDVVYLPGEHGAFRPQYYDDIPGGSSTPDFGGEIAGRDGYEFAGWTPEWENTVTKDVKYVAQWKPLGHTVTYVGNGHTSGSVPEDNALYTEGNSVTVSGNTGNLAREGYTFAGWSATYDGAVQYIAGGTLTMGGSDVTLYAVWRENPAAPPTPPPVTPPAEIETYTVTYLPGTRGTFTAQITRDLLYGAGTPAAPEVTGQTGWRFTGWNLTPSASVTGNAVYTALWEQIEYTVRFNDWNGTALKTERVVHGGNAEAPANPARDGGYVFAGWDGAFTNVTGDLTLTALYTPPQSEPDDSEDPGPVVPVTPVTPVTPADPAPAIPAGPAAPTPVEAAPAAADPETEALPDPVVPAADGDAIPGSDQSLTPDDVLRQIQEEGIPTANIGEQEVPLASGSKTGFVWALSNLILCVTGALLAVITLIRALTRRNKEEDGYMSDYSERRNRSRSLWLTLTVAAGAVGVILFFLTENISLPMVLTDSWTVANALIFAAEAVCMGLVSKRGKDGGEDGSSGLLETSAT